ncbi:MAG TPA: aminotransferase class V-fold PLP-dependent enzyme [Gaiellaceae bacterium]|nr:aminotransferase class V-fold PLP-dependent enzyme [Gaiellaceae bacterium]
MAAETTAEPAAALPGRVRHRFPIFERLTYVNSCSQGALSDAVRAAYEDYLRDWDEQGAPWEYWVERAEAARGAFAALVGAEPDEVAVTTSLSAGVSALFSGLRFEGERTTIVVSDFEFPTVGQIAHAQELRGRRVVHVPEAGDATIPLEHFDAAIDERTALVAVTHVCYRNGSRVDVEGVVRLAHERGALVLVDAYQAAGAIPLDVRALGVDFLAAGTVKYLLGSAGLAFLYCRSDLIDRIRPTSTGWFADEDIFQMDIHDYSPSPTARRFEFGTPPIPNIYAGLAGLRLVEEIGVAETEAHVRGLTAQLVEGVDGLGGRVVTPRDPDRRGPLVAVASTDEHALVAALAADGIVTSSRDGNLRVSFHGYNSNDDVEAVLAALARHRALLAD